MLKRGTTSSYLVLTVVCFVAMCKQRKLRPYTSIRPRSALGTSFRAAEPLTLYAPIYLSLYIRGRSRPVVCTRLCCRTHSVSWECWSGLRHLPPVTSKKELIFSPKPWYYLTHNVSNRDVHAHINILKKNAQIVKKAYHVQLQG